MGKDYLKKEPTKNEKMIYEIYMQLQNMERGLWSTSTLGITIAMLAKVDPKAIAEMMVNGNEKIKEFSKQINDEVDRLEKEKNPAASHEGHDHAGHDHSEVEKSEEKTEEQA